jgi:NarL family two-component system sensor histidine kinase LiaS
MLLDNNSLARLMNSSPNTDRSRLARELHDGLAQELAAIGYNLDSVIGQESLGNQPRTQLRALRSNISALIEQVRNEIYELRNETNRTFSESIRSQCESLLTGTNIKYEIQGDLQISKDINYEILRCIRELVLNSIEHSNCKNIDIKLSDNLITYTDDGAFKSTTNNMNFGLRGLRERVENFGGELIQNNSIFQIKLP